MLRKLLCAQVALLLLLPLAARGQEPKQLADTLAIQADATYEADPDLATLVFDVTTQDKQLRKAYEQATSALQRILQVAERNGIARADISTGRFTVEPFYESNDRKLKARSYRVSGRITLRVRDFQRIGPLIDDSVQEGVTEFRSLTYSLADEEAAKQQAVAQAMRRAEGRARAALGDGSRKLGPLRYANVDIRQIVPVLRGGDLTALVQSKIETYAPTPMPALPSPEKISVSASVQCVFQLQ